MSDSPALDLSMAMLRGEIGMDDIMAMATPRDDPGEPPYSAEDFGLMREVSLAWPEEHRSEANSWTVHSILRNHPERFELIKEPMTEDQARVLVQEVVANSNTIIDGQRRTHR